MFEIYKGGTKFNQWDLNRCLVMEEFEVGTQVAFANQPDEIHPLITEVYVNEEGVKVCDVPNILLTVDKNFSVTVPYTYPNGKVEVLTKSFEIDIRLKPKDYVYVETDTVEECEDEYEDLEARIEHLEKTGGGGGVVDHSDLEGLDDADQHPIEAIIGLKDTLDNKLDGAGFLSNQEILEILNS